MRPLIARKTLFIEASPDRVWAIHADVARWGQWQRSVSATRLVGPLGVGSKVEWISSGLNIISTVRIWEPDRQTVWTGRALGIRANHSWLLQPWDTGTLVTTEESIGGWKVPLLKMFKPAFLNRSLDDWLSDLKSVAEAAPR